MFARPVSQGQRDVRRLQAVRQLTVDADINGDGCASVADSFLGTVTIGGSSGSRAGTASSIGGTRRGPRVLEPVLSVRRAENWLSDPRGPPRRRGHRAALPSALQHEDSVEVSVAVPKYNGFTQDAVVLDSSRRTGGNGQSLRPLSQRRRWRQEQQEALALEAAAECRPTSDMPDEASEVPARKPSPFTLTETLSGISTIGKCNIFRHELDDAVLLKEMEAAELAGYRLECAKRAQTKERQTASYWRNLHERNSAMHALQWHCEDTKVKQFFHLSDGLPTHTSLMVQHEELKAVEINEIAGAEDIRNALKRAGGTRLTRKPLKVRMQNLRRKARMRRKEKEESPSDHEGEAVMKKDRSSDEAIQFVKANLPKEILPSARTSPEMHSHEDKKEREDEESPKSPKSPKTLTVEISCALKDDEESASKCQTPPSITPSGRQTPGQALIRPNSNRALTPSIQNFVGQVRSSTLGLNSPFGNENDSPRFSPRQNVEIVRSGRRRSTKDTLSRSLGDREHAALSAAFEMHDADFSGTLDQPELRHCLADLGLRGKTKAERSLVRAILWEIDSLTVNFKEFSEEIVPQVRRKLRELRRNWLLQLFQEVDIHLTKKVSIEDALNALRRHGTLVSDDIRDEALRAFVQEAGQTATSMDPSDMMDAESFVLYLSILLERTDRDAVSQFYKVSKRYCLCRDDQDRWRDELVDLYKAFHEYDPCSGKYGSSSGMLTMQEVVTVVRESGYMPKTRNKQLQLNTMIQDSLDVGERLNFLQFLEIMHRLRELDSERLRKVFEANCNAQLGIMSMSEVTHVLPDCSILPKTADEKFEIKALMEDSDRDGYDCLSCGEFVRLCQRMALRLRVMQRERERQYVLSAGWSEQLYIELRSVYQIFDEDMSEVLERDELIKAVELLKGQYWQSSQNINLMFIALGIDPGKEIKVNFLTFLRMLKMLDESENRRQQGAMVGFSRDRTDKLYSAFQALEPESNGTVSRHLLEQVLTDISRNLARVQLGEVLRILDSEPVQVEFNAFLRTMKTLEGMTDGQFEPVLNDVLAWPSRNHHGDDDSD